jgi:uncharacterized membrane protein YbhN (UPF0104 family)
MMWMVNLIKRLWKKPLTRGISSLLILGALLTQMPLATLIETMRQISVPDFLLTLSAFIIGHLVGVAKWTLLINTGHNTFTYLSMVRCYFAGLFANLFLPSIAGGDIIRGGLAIRQNRKVKGAVILGSLLDRFLDIVALVLLILFGAIFAPLGLIDEGNARVVTTLILLLVLVFGTVLFMIVPLPSATPKLAVKIIEKIRTILKELIIRPQRALLCLGLSLFIQGSFVLLNAFLAMQIGLKLPLAVWFLTWPLAKLAATLPVSLGGLGMREAALALFLGKFGVNMVSAVSLGLLWQAVLICSGFLGGVYYFLSCKKIPTAKELDVTGATENSKA